MEFKYSVLMPLYHGDNPEHVVVAIDSMINQTLKPEEIFIAVDGPISQELTEIIERYHTERSELFTVKYYPESRGIALTLRDALLLCRNEFIARMDADDYSAPARIEKQAAVFAKHPSFSIVGCNVDEFIDDINKPVAHVVLPETPEEVKKFAKRRTPMRHPAMLYKKSDIIAVGSYSSAYIAEDYDLVVRVICDLPNGNGETKGGKIYNLQEVLVYMRVSGNFYNRRGRAGMKVVSSSIKLKFNFFRSGFSSFTDFMISSLGQTIVALMPNFMREWFYKKFLRS